MNSKLLYQCHSSAAKIHIKCNWWLMLYMSLGGRLLLLSPLIEQGKEIYVRAGPMHIYISTNISLYNHEYSY